MTFAIPGLLTGIVMAFILNLSGRAVLFYVAENYTSYNLSLTALNLGLGIGIILPLVSNILPIQRALGKNLRTSLDINHRGSASDMAITMLKLSEYGLSPSQVALSLGLVILGILCYYVGP